jgi:hypothetical protein
MSKLEAHDTAWTDLATVLESNGAAKRKSSHPSNDTEQERQRWQEVLDHWLMEWAQDPTRLEDEGIVAPAADIIQLASQIASDLRDAGVPGPHRVAATGDGGIVFVRQVGPLVSTLEIEANGSIELAVFRDARLVSRQRLR